ncbi:MAG: aldo/keto reductase [Desulfobacterales bacterium]|nr:aldo/keto reductase [Desulfobacterales bacterium]
MKNNPELSTVSINQLVLGTVQLGMPYGIANKLGQPNQNNATKIIEFAWNSGIKEFDTAQGYGEAEIVLGKAFQELGISDEVAVINKFSDRIDHLNEEIMQKELDKSLEKLGLSHFSSMMIHDESLLFKCSRGLGDIFQKFIQLKKFDSVGISIYSPENAIKALHEEVINFIQVPGNVIDRRFEEFGVFDLAKKKNKKVYIRSIFLQGLLLMEPEQIPTKMNYSVPVIERFISLSDSFGLTREETAIGFIKNGFPECKVLLGVDSLKHLQKNMKAWSLEYPEDLVKKVREVFSDVPDNITNWNLWPK